MLLIRGHHAVRWGSVWGWHVDTLALAASMACSLTKTGTWAIGVWLGEIHVIHVWITNYTILSSQFLFQLNKFWWNKIFL